jgi:DNA-directed RNA polymerase II subunit RPB2
MRTFLLKELNSGTWRVSGRLVNLVTKSNIYKIVRHTTASSRLMYALATGNWGIKNSRCKQGVAQVLNRMTYIATVSHLRRVNTPIEKNGELVQPRKLFATSWEIICPAETPEGASIGLVKNLALTTIITTHTPTCIVLERLFRMGVDENKKEMQGRIGSCYCQRIGRRKPRRSKRALHET